MPGPRSHDWERFDPADPQLLWSTLGSRRCRKCKRVQHKERNVLWGRVSGYYWAPPAGRCPGPHDTSADATTSAP